MAHKNSKMKLTIEIPNLSRIISKQVFENKEKNLLVRRLVLKTGANIQAKAKINQTPHVDTGRLRNSIDMSYSFDSTGAESIVGSDVEYAGYHEASYPYLSPAAHDYAKPFVAGIKEIIIK